MRGLDKVADDQQRQQVSSVQWSSEEDSIIRSICGYDIKKIGY